MSSSDEEANEADFPLIIHDHEWIKEIETKFWVWLACFWVNCEKKLKYL